MDRRDEVGIILAIDPGTEKSAFVQMTQAFEPINFDILPNTELLEGINGYVSNHNYVAAHAVIEMVASYGMPVGEAVFETVFWIGRFWEALHGVAKTKMYRNDVKMNLCQSMRAKDSNITRALVDRFAKHDFLRGKGTKKNPDWFYGFKDDIWQAYACGVTWIDMHGGRR